MDARVITATLATGLLAASAGAVDHGVVATKLVIIDRTASTGTAKVVFVVKDPGVTKGAGTDRATVRAVLDVAYDAEHGDFVAPMGPGWVANGATTAVYRNADAPAGGAVRAASVIAGRTIKVIAPSLGDQELDIAAAPTGAVFAAFTIENGAETHRHCTQFTGCTHEVSGGRRMLVCRGGSTADPDCRAVPPPTTTTTVLTTTTTTGPPTTLQIATSVDCCQGAGACINGYGFSLNFNLMQYCSAFLPGSSGVWGGVCQPDGACQVQPLAPPRRLCCQYGGPACYHSSAPVTSTAGVWSFRNNCVGGLLGTAYFDAVCGPGGTCIPE